MARRLSAFVLALAFAGASATSAVCLVACEWQESHATAGHAHQHSHPPSARVVGAALTAATPGCAHQIGSETVAVPQAAHALPPPTVVTVQALGDPPVAGLAIVTRPIPIEHSPPGLLALTARLRV